MKLELYIFCLVALSWENLVLNMLCNCLTWLFSSLMLATICLRDVYLNFLPLISLTNLEKKKQSTSLYSKPFKSLLNFPLCWNALDSINLKRDYQPATISTQKQISKIKHMAGWCWRVYLLLGILVALIIHILYRYKREEDEQKEKKAYGNLLVHTEDENSVFKAIFITMQAINILEISLYLILTAPLLLYYSIILTT